MRSQQLVCSFSEFLLGRVMIHMYMYGCLVNGVYICKVLQLYRLFGALQAFTGTT